MGTALSMKKKKNLIRTVATGPITSDLKKNIAFVNTNIYIPHNLCGTVSVI